VRGWPSETPFRGGPIFTLPLPIGPIVFVTVISWFLSLAIPSPFGPGPIFNDLAFVPVEFLVHLADGEVAAALVPLFTHVLLHDPTGPGHLLLNMLWLMVFGSGIARRLCIPGTQAGDRSRNVLVFLSFYLLAAAAGGLAHLATHTYETGPLIGASGAISGLMGGTLRFALRLFAPMGAEYGRLAPVYARPVLVASAIYVGLNLATGVAGGMGAEGMSTIAWEAHIGGFLFGLLAFPLFDRLAKRPPLPFGLS
jgi:membrane associated rhomboid family serine protease